MEVQTIPEGESGLARFQLTDERATVLSSFWATPTAFRSELLAKNEVELAKTLGVTTKWLNEVKRRPEMVAAVRDKIHTAAVYAMPDVLMKQIGAAETGDTKAARFVAEISGVIKQHGIQVNNNVINPMIKEELSDQAVQQAFEDIIARRLPKVDPREPDAKD